MTEFKKISELDRITTLNDNDLFVVETITGTKAITRSAFKDEADMPTKEDIGLGNVDNTSDLDKPLSTATQEALNLKVDTSSLNITLSNYLTTSVASDTYLTKNNASGIYLNKEDANTYYLQKTDASNTYLTQSSATEDYLSKTDASTTYATKEELNNALSGLEQLLSEV